MKNLAKEVYIRSFNGLFVKEVIYYKLDSGLQLYE